MQQLVDLVYGPSETEIFFFLNITSYKFRIVKLSSDQEK